MLILSIILLSQLKFGFILFVGTVGGVYLGVDYGIASIRGTRDWVLPRPDLLLQ